MIEVDEICGVGKRAERHCKEEGEAEDGNEEGGLTIVHGGTGQRKDSREGRGMGNRYGEPEPTGEAYAARQTSCNDGVGKDAGTCLNN